MREPDSYSVNINGHILAISHLNKVYFPEAGLTKGEVIQYYKDMAPYILPHIKRSPFVMVRFPEGIQGDFFYQKECPAQAPEWITRFKDPHSESGLTYIVCDQLPILIYLINLGCIEIHAWAATVDHPEFPEWAVFDLDPDPPSGIKEAYQVACYLGEILRELNIKFMVKTSGSKGIHILLPILPLYSYKEVQRGVEGVCRFLFKQRPEMCTLERSIRKREGKIYLDYLQNGRGRTMAGIYSIRPNAQSQVSTPLLWEEVREGVDPSQFNVRTLKQRINDVGDLSKIMNEKNDFKKILHYFT